MAIVDDNFDVSIIIDSNEEEEKKGEEKVKDIEIELSSKNSSEDIIYLISSAKSLSFLLDNYNSLFKELNSPPPESNIY